MRWMVAMIGAGLAAVLVAGPAGAAEKPAPIEVMVLGSYHMDNPAQDLHNAHIDPVTTPAKQAQLADVARRLARFRPNVLAVERTASDQATLVDQGWARFTPAALMRDGDERVQLGYRLAQLAGITRVYAIDEPYDFPYEGVQAWAKAHDRQAALDQLGAATERFTQALTRDQRMLTVAQLLAKLNAPDAAQGEMSQGASYYQFLRFGGGHEQPGAVLNGQWYTRNAIIFAKLVKVARPGDRVVVVYGSGHGYWLRHFVSTMPGYTLVDPVPYLTR